MTALHSVTPPVYTYLVADLVTNRTLAEIPLTGVRYSKRLNDSGQLSGTFPLGDPRVRSIDPYDLTTPVRRVVYVLRDAAPIWGGLVWTRRYDSASQRVTIGCGDFWSYFDHRKVLPRLPPAAYQDPRVVAALRVAWTNTEQSRIVGELIALTARHDAGDIGVTVVPPPGGSGAVRDRTYFGYQNADVGDALRKLSAVADGPDLAFDVGPTDAHGRPTRRLLVGGPRLGQQGSAHVWEYGGNLVGYTWPSDGSRMATRAFAAGDGIEAGTLIAVSEDPEPYRNGWPLLESEHGYSSVTDPAQLRSHAASDQRVARLPVVLPTLAIHGGLPPTTADFGLGDDARVIIEDPFHTAGIDTAMRIVGIDVSVGDGGDEAVTLTMNPLLEDVA
ncbi:hypothetical protein [Streptomyces syringium]|uniref:hypothetical protein n=1 Tax=Streptomyces syringium TaxID=76729 RepID=UPI00343A48C8